MIQRQQPAKGQRKLTTAPEAELMALYGHLLRILKDGGDPIGPVQVAQ